MQRDEMTGLLYEPLKININLKNNSKMRKFKHGQEVQDKITGFKGIVTGFADYMTGCNQYCVQPPVKNEEYKEGLWFDEGKLELVPNGKNISPKTVKAKENGCDITAPVKN